MTSPHVELGNVGTDLGGFAKGLVDARQRAATIAMQQALAQSKINLEGSQAGHFDAETNSTTQLLPFQQGHMEAQSVLGRAQAGDAQAQQALREHLNEPAGPAELQMLQKYWPHMTMDHLQGLTRGDAHELFKNGLMFQKMQNTMGMGYQRLFMTGGNEAYNHFVHHPDVLKAYDAKDAYDNFRGLLASNSAVGYNEVFGSLARMALPNNARAVGQMLNKLQQTGVLKGPFNPNENVLLTLNKLTNTQGTLPLTDSMRQELYNTANAMIVPHVQKYDGVKKTILGQMQAEGLPFGDSYLESEDKFSDIRGLAKTNQLGPAGPTAPGPTQSPPQVPQGINPRFMPGATRPGPGVTQ